MAVLPSEVTVTAVVATTNITPAEREPCNQNQGEGYVKGLAYGGFGLTHGQTFVHHGVVEEAAGCVLHSKAVPHWKVVDGEQVVLVGWSQELPVVPEIFMSVLF